MKSLLQKGYISLVYGLLYIPIFVLILYSVNDARFSLQWHGFSMQWYTELMQDKALWAAFLHSIYLGVTASLISTVSGLLACVSLFLHPSNTRDTYFYTTLLLLIIIPDLVLGI
ncbi:MAG TPA: spermidine/putrescine ABC transporter permease PotC, partial [Legionella sp.]|nr:spermidine/putrescine ABC transporter permease PotC [Legionella sp.]